MTPEERFDQLENKLACQKRQGQWLLVGILLVVAAWIVLTQYGIGSRYLDSIRVRELVLVDERGETRALLSVTQNEPSLLFVDEKGETRTLLGVTHNGPSLLLRDETGAARAGLLVTQDGPMLLFKEEKGAERDRFPITQSRPSQSF
jgi:hypothetical protein